MLLSLDAPVDSVAFKVANLRHLMTPLSITQNTLMFDPCNRTVTPKFIITHFQLLIDGRVVPLAAPSSNFSMRAP